MRKEVLEYDFSPEACEKGESPYPAGEKTEAECVSIIAGAGGRTSDHAHGGRHGRRPANATRWSSRPRPPTKVNSSWSKPLSEPGLS